MRTVGYINQVARNKEQELATIHESLEGKK